MTAPERGVKLERAWESPFGPSPGGVDAATPQYAGRALLLLALAALGCLAGWAAGALPWKVVLGMAIGVFMSIPIVVSPVAGCVFLAVALPLVDLVPPQIAGLKGLNPLNLILILVAASWIGHVVLRRTRPFPPNPIGAPLLAFALVLSLSLMVTVQHVSSERMRVVTDDLKTSLTSFAPFFLTVGIVRTEKQRRAVLYAVMVMVILVALRACVEYGVEIAHGTQRERLRLGGILGQPNEFGGYLAMYIPVILVMGLGERGPLRRALLLGGGVLCVFVLLLTQSRGGIVACVVSLMLLGILRERRLLAAMLVALALTPIWVPSVVIDRFSRTRVVSQETGAERLDNSSQARLEMWSGGVSLFKASPLVGQGFGSWFDALEGSGFVGFRGKILAPHSTYVRTLAENGLVGMGCFLWLLISVLRLAARRRPTDQRFDARLRNGLLGAGLALVVVNLFGTRMYNIEEMGYFWIVVGLVAACGPAGGRSPVLGGRVRGSMA